MTADPIFQPPTVDGRGVGAPPADAHRADIIQIDTALESMRDSGFDLTAAAGEPIDNSVEAGATTIRVFTKYGANKRSIDEIAIADNGRGISPLILSRVLSMGFSSRYGQRSGLGRFGVGMKLAGLSLGRRIDVYTKESGDPQIRQAYLDLDEIKAGTQRYISARNVEAWPADYADAMTDDGGAPASGTLVVYSKVDRLTGGGDYGTSLDEKIAELRTFIARAYRKYLDKALRIELNRKEVTLLDPYADLERLKFEGEDTANDLVNLHIHYTPGEHNLEEILAEAEKVYPRWYARDWVQTNALGETLTLGEADRSKSLREIVQGYADTELQNYDEVEKQQLLTLLGQIIDECEAVG